MHTKRGYVYFAGLIICFTLLVVGFVFLYPNGLFAQEKDSRGDPSSKKAWRPNGPLTLMCFTGPGTAYDYLARQMVQVLPDYLGKRAIVRAVVGGGGGNALDTLHSSRPDGKTFLLYSIGSHVALTVEKRYKWDINDFNLILAVDVPPYGILVSAKNSNYKNFKDLMTTKEVVRIATGGANLAILPLILQLEKSGVKYKVARFKDNTAAFLAVIAGDAEITISALSSTALDPIRAGDFRALWQFSTRRLPELPDVPHLVELGMPREWESYNVTRLLALPPGVPLDIQNSLTEALIKILQDKRTVEWSKKAEIPVDIVKRKELEGRIRVIEAGFKQNREIIQRYFF